MPRLTPFNAYPSYALVGYLILSMLYLSIAPRNGLFWSLGGHLGGHLEGHITIKTILVASHLWT